MNSDFLNKKVIIIVGIVLLCVVSNLFLNGNNDADNNEKFQKDIAKLENDVGIKIYVSGAVNNPGIYTIKGGSRAIDAIEAAGGTTQIANMEKVNLAKPLKDGMQVNVPSLKGKQNIASTYNSNAISYIQNKNEKQVIKQSSSQKSNAMQIVHLQNADCNTLMTLPGIGAATAQKIIEYRNQHGFSSKEDLMKVKGIGSAKFAKLKDRVEL